MSLRHFKDGLPLQEILKPARLMTTSDSKREIGSAKESTKRRPQKAPVSQAWWTSGKRWRLRNLKMLEMWPVELLSAYLKVAIWRIQQGIWK
jgi:hypothetical protein